MVEWIYEVSDCLQELLYLCAFFIAWLTGLTIWLCHLTFKKR